MWKMAKCWKFDHLFTLLLLCTSCSMHLKMKPGSKIVVCTKFLKNGFVQRKWEKCILYRDILLLVKEFMFTWLHPLITTDLILPDRTPVSYWWNTAEICSGEAFIQLWVHHLVTRRFIMISHFTIKPFISKNKP